MIFLRALPLSIYLSKNMSDTSNNGISNRFPNVLLIHESGYIDIDENDIPDNLVKVVTRNLFGKEYKHIEPYKEATGVGYMTGGALAYTSDGRFSEISQYPLSIHDRQETQEEYNRFSL